MKNKARGRGSGGGDLIESGGLLISSSEKGGLLERGGGGLFERGGLLENLRYSFSTNHGALSDLVRSINKYVFAQECNPVLGNCVSQNKAFSPDSLPAVYFCLVT